MKEPITLSAFLKQYLKENNISQIILAQDSGISVKTINALYLGRQKSINEETAINLEKATRIPAEKWLNIVTERKLWEARKRCS